MLDLAHRAWPEVGERKALLLRLAAVGGEVVAGQVAVGDAAALRDRQRAALSRAGQLVDVELLDADAAWR